MQLAEDGGSVSKSGVLRDRCGPVVTFGDLTEVRADYAVEVGELPQDFDPSWQRKAS